MSGDLNHFYELVDQLSQGVGGPRKLADCSAKQGWPQRGVYFFFEPGEFRVGQLNRHRVVRIGTHGLHPGASSTLLGRLRQHRGSKSGTGNHRGSVFRKHVGRALLSCDEGKLRCDTWGHGSHAAADVRQAERELESAVSSYLGSMSVLWLDIADGDERGFIEKNAIGLLSGKELASESWLGLHSDKEAIRHSYLWNVNHVEESPSIRFLKLLESCVKRTISSR